MLYYQDLEKTILDRCFKMGADELDIISGYIGPKPIEDLRSRLSEGNKNSFKTDIVYGMYGADGISRQLHGMLTPLNNPPSLEICYSKTPVHTKLYIWRTNHEIVYSLIGSANFTLSGLGTPFKETLAEPSYDTFTSIDNYYKLVKSGSIPCTDPSIAASLKGASYPTVDDLPQIPSNVKIDEATSYPLSLLDPKTGEVQDGTGLNWGQSKLLGSHVNINDASLVIRKKDLADAPFLFPRKRSVPLEMTKTGKNSRDNDPIEILWDDGTRMVGLLEGSQIGDDGYRYPKQISTTPSKAQLGIYLRKRLGLSSGQKITNYDLSKYGRTTIKISLIGEGIYYFDFSKK